MSLFLKNSLIYVQVSSCGSIVVTDVKNKIKWGSELPGFVILNDGKLNKKIPLSKPIKIKQYGNKITVEFGNLKPDQSREIDFSMNVELSLLNNSLEIEIVNVNTYLKLIEIEYPAQLFTVMSGEEIGYIVIPFKQGIIIPSRLDAGFMRFMHNTWSSISDIERILPFESDLLNMHWFGAVKGNSNIFCNIITPDDCSLHIIGNAVVNDDGFVVNARQGENPGVRKSSLSPVWMSSYGTLNYSRKLRIELVSNGYVGMAKRYLQYSKECGRFVSLKDKIKQNPLVERIIGAPDIKIWIYTNRQNTPYLRAWSEPILDGYRCVHTTFKQVGEMAIDLKALGIDRSLILLGGWNHAGYDREYIDTWPPAVDAGGINGLAEASKVVSDSGYLFSLHNDYQDFYTDAPSYDEKYLMKHEDGTVKLGGIWDGGLCRLICSSKAIELAEKNLNAVEETTQTNSYYLDTIAAPLYECYDEKHPMTRGNDRQNKINLLKYLNDHSLVVGGEGGTDWAIPVCSFFEGLPGSVVGIYTGIESPNYGEPFGKPNFGLVVPLFNLVYHDAVVCYWQHGQPFGREDHANHVLHDLMNGQPSSWSLTYDQWEDLKPLIKQCYDLLSHVHRKTAFYPMLTHELLKSDFTVHKTSFGDGSEVIVNFGITSYVNNDFKIPPKGFIVKIPGETIKIGAVSRDIVFQY